MQNWKNKWLAKMLTYFADSGVLAGAQAADELRRGDGRIAAEQGAEIRAEVVRGGRHSAAGAAPFVVRRAVTLAALRRRQIQFLRRPVDITNKLNKKY